MSPEPHTTLADRSCASTFVDQAVFEHAAAFVNGVLTLRAGDRLQAARDLISTAALLADAAASIEDESARTLIARVMAGTAHKLDPAAVSAVGARLQ